MSDERRNHERKPVCSELIDGQFAAICGDKTLAFTMVDDISISGVGIVLPEKLENGAELRLRYSSEGIDLEVRGSVAWVVDSEQGFRTGVHFDSQNMNDNVMFFMTLREYIDDSGALY